MDEEKKTVKETVFLDVERTKELVAALDEKHEQEIEDAWNRAY